MTQGDDEVEAGGAAPATGALVGRERELALLTHGLDAAVTGRSQLFLVAGEAGIGKSRLADEIARAARDRGVLVVWGRCWEAGGAPAYWPWVQALRTCLREVPGAGARHADVAEILEPAHQRTDTSSTWTDADSARFQQFDAVTTFLLDTARQRPILLLLDDLQSADAPSLLLLRFLAHQLDETPLMVVGTFRREELSQDRQLTDAVADLTRLPNARRLDLVGLDGPEVAHMVEEVTGTRPSPAVAAALLLETAGNPFFVSEISRLAAAEGRLDEVDPTYWERTIPQGVRQVVGLRVDRLSRECARVLSVASVLGREFRTRDLSRLSGLELEDLDEVLDEAADSGLIMAEPTRPGLHRFSHAVIRDTLYDELPASHRARLHVQAGEILESAEGDIRSAATAHHYFHAGPRAGVERIVATAQRGGDHALGLLAYEEAARVYRMAVTALSWADTADLTTECRLQLSLGDAASRAGDHHETRRSFLRAAELAEAVGDDHSFARAALGYGGRFVWLRAAADPKLVPMLERALTAIEAQDLELRARLMARLAGAKRDEVDRTARDALSAKAVALARRSGDDGLLAYALVGRHAAMLGPRHAPGALGPPDELLAVAARSGNAELRFEGLMHRLVRTMEVGDHVETLDVADQLDRIAGELRQPTHQWFALATRANLALVHGALAEADDLISGAMAVGLRSQNWDAQGFGDIQRFVLRREQARLDEMRERVQESIRTYPTRPLFACMAAVAAVELGDHATARAVLEPLAADGFRAVPLNNDWSLSTVLLAEVVHALGDQGPAASLYEVLRPAAGSCVETVEMSVGSIDRALGLLALTTGRIDEAVEHLEIALACNERIGARPWAAQTRLALAEALRRRDGDGDAMRAERELEHASAVSRELGLISLQQRIEAAAPTRAEVPRRSGRPTAARGGVFRSEGDVWVVGVDGAEHRVRATKGLGYVAALLAAPARQIHALDLVGSVSADARRAGRAAAAELEPARGGGGDEVLDARARAAYRERIEILQAEIDEAEEWNDSTRASAAREELDFLIEELTAASGLGGRSRSFTSDAERARVNATRAIRAAVTKIGEHDTPLAWHLDRSLRTGTYCSYQPDHEAPVDWRLS